MKLKITPLNIVQALTIVAMIYLLYAQDKSNPIEKTSNGFYFLILICLVFVTIVTDLLFRILLKDLKRIWLIESIFVVITAVLIVIMKKLT